MSLATDIKALKSRCTALESRCAAIEAKDRSQDTTIASTQAGLAAVTARVSALEAVTHADYSAEIAKLREEVDALTTWMIYNVNDYPPGQPPMEDYYNAVEDGGLDNEGTEDCVAGIGTCITAYKAAEKDGLYFPDGTYLLSSTLTVPDGTVFVGSGLSSAQLKGAVVYNSNSSFTDLKIGDLGKTGITNGASASTTTFTRCQFRGGSGMVVCPVHFGGGTNDADHITFNDCNVERNLNDYATADANNSNNVYFVEAVGDLNGSHMEYISFYRCNFGVDNGRRDIARSIGAPRGDVELYQYPGSGVVRTGWHHVEFWDCYFPAGDRWTFNPASAVYNGAHTDGYLVVDGCTFYGGGTGGGVSLEGPNYMTVNDCDIYPAYLFCLSSIASGGVDSHHVVITNNRLHFDDYTNAVITSRSTDPAIFLQGTSGTFTGNTIHKAAGSYTILWMGRYGVDTICDGWTVTGNNFCELDSMAQEMVRFWDATDCTVTGNTFQTAYTSDPTFSYSGTNTGTTVIDGVNNTLVHA
jgi:hypothetical protein